MKKYYPRIADKLLDEALESAGAVLIEGPKWCGKTWTAVKSRKVFYICRIQIQEKAIFLQPTLNQLCF